MTHTRPGRPPQGWRFWLITFAAFAGVALTASLGSWQLSRAAQKQALQAGMEARRQLPELEGRSLVQVTDPAALVHRRIALRGRWLTDRTVYLDNRQMNGRPGFYVLTPLQLEASPTVVLVQRGWVPRNLQDRAALPAVQSPSGTVVLAGRIAPPPGRLYEFAGAESGPIRQNLDLAAYRAETGLPLAPLTVLQTGEPSEGLLRQWPEAASGAEKHQGYAFQWFGLAGLIALLYVWFQLVRRFRSPS